jgi:septum formation inhibitor-activating ATPase MinD
VTFNPTIVTAVVGGVVALVVAIVSIAPNFGQLRRLERMVALLEKTNDATGRERLLEMRNVILERLAPTSVPVRECKSLSTDVLVRMWWSICVVGLGADIAGLILISIKSVQIFAELAIAVGATAGVVGLVYAIRATEGRDRERAEQEAAISVANPDS